MGRRRRPHLPGCVFHLTARTLGGERLLGEPEREAALALIAEVVPASQARLLAVAVMSNHLHLVVQQGEPPLSALMQPLLRRLAHHLQRAHGRDGPIFWRHFGSQPCMNPEHVRNAIVYTHLNPVRAGLCSRPIEYPWTSHRPYAGMEARPEPGRGGGGNSLARIAARLDVDHALPLFASRAGRTGADLHADYCRFVERRLLADQSKVRQLTPPPPPPLALEWDEAWSGYLTPLFHDPARPGRRADPVLGRPPRYVPDLAAIAGAVLIDVAPHLRTEAIKGRYGGRRYAEIRHLMIRRMSAAGHRNAAIARFLGLSESAVSKVICAARSHV